MFTLFKTSRTHMFLACRLAAPAPSHVVGPDGVVAVHSQQDLLAGKDGKAVTGARPREPCVGLPVDGGTGRLRQLRPARIGSASRSCTCSGSCWLAGLCWGASEVQGFYQAGQMKAPEGAQPFCEKPKNGTLVQSH